VGSESQQRAVFKHSSFDLDRFVARLSSGDQVLIAVLDPFYRATEMVGGGANRDVLSENGAFGPERTADVADDDVWHAGHVSGEESEERAAEVLESTWVAKGLLNQNGE
jgi:hypothetical protein